MRFLLAVSLALLCASASATPMSAYLARFEAFKAKYGRKYATDLEEAKRFTVFVENMKKAAELQKQNPLARFGENEYADMSAAEFKSRHSAEPYFKATQARRKPVAPLFSKEELKAGSIDWRKKGAVTYVKNQGSNCGSCWSFSTTGNIEGQWAIAGNPLTALSEQQLVSCDTTDGGCHGGVMDNAWTWLVSTQGGNIVTEASYPYVSGDGNVPSCSIPSGSVGATITGHQDLPQDESQMATWMLTGGPISIGVDATSWQTYQGGVMTNCIAQKLDHAVLAVGFDDNHNPPYWIIKNSWGASWGESGFIRIQKGVNECLIESAPCTSIVGNTTVPPSPPSPPSPPTTIPPTPPTPTLPPTPPAQGTFTQYTCSDSTCQDGCQGTTFQQGKCLALQNGSAIVVCGTTNLHLTIYTTSSCTGSSQSALIPLDQCSSESDGTYVYDTCQSGSNSGNSGASDSSSTGNVVLKVSALHAAPKRHPKVRKH